MTIDCAFYGFLSADPEPRVAEGSGKKWTRLRVGVGQGENVQWLQVAVFGDAAETAGALKKSDRVYVEGTITIRNWQDSKGEQRHGLSVASHSIVRTHNIGKRRTRHSNKVPRPEGQSTRPPPAEPEARSFDDSIPL